MEKVLVSACLLGDKCRYDGKDNLVNGLEELSSYFDLVPFCPEVEGGLKTPRLPSEIKHSQVKNIKGEDVTSSYYRGAEKAFNICSYLGIKLAILKENSPSCGVHKIHDGKFDGKVIDGEGVTTSFLRRKGIKVINESEALDLIKSIKENEMERLKVSIEKREQDNKPKQEDKEKVERKPFDKNKNFARRVDKEGISKYKSFRKDDKKQDSFKKEGNFKKRPYKKDDKKDGKFISSKGKSNFKKDRYSSKDSYKGKKAYSKSNKGNYSSNKRSYGKKPFSKVKENGSKDK